MTKYSLLPLAILLAACAPSDPPDMETDAASAEVSADTGADPAPLTYMEPTPSDADLDSAVAPYVMARGAGPSRLLPDGATIATRLSLTGVRQLYVMDATADEPKETLQQLSFGSGITFFEVSPTGAILFGSDNNGDERENYWLVSPAEDGTWAEPRLILSATDKGFRQFGGFTADGQTIVYASTERTVSILISIRRMSQAAKPPASMRVCSAIMSRRSRRMAAQPL